MKRLTLDRLVSSIRHCQHCSSTRLSNTYVKEKTIIFLPLLQKLQKYEPYKPTLHRFFALIFFIVKALRQRRQIQEVMKQ
jgi:hypothetical protein